MYRKPLFFFILVLALVTMACSFTINLPVNEMSIGPTQTDTIEVAKPDSSSAKVYLSFGAGELSLSPGAQAGLIEGTATYNVEDLKPEVDINGSTIRIKTGEFRLRGIPRFGDDFKNEWDLNLGDLPMDLDIEAGAYKGRYELGGLSLQSLQVSDGASDVELDFSEPNLVEMDEFRYSTGASSVELNSLANANFDSMVFRSGAGDYRLDFSGELQRDARVRIESGISQVVILVPQGVPASLRFEGGLSNISLSGDWQKSGSQYTHPGSGAELTIDVSMGAGNLDLRTQ
ncbi:MAG: toast rack family protein [Anaerolineales bacterium]|jgi:hypothetical protein